MARLLRANLIACFYAALVIAAVLGPVHHSVFHVWEPAGAGSHHAHHPHHDDSDDSHHGDALANHDDALADADDAGDHEADCCGFQLARERVKTVSHDVTKATFSVISIASLLPSAAAADSRAPRSARSAERPPDSPGDIARLRTILLLV
jgi:hypothetical protein